MKFYKVVRKAPKLPYGKHLLYSYTDSKLLENHYVFDIETTGLDENRDIMICFGILDIQKAIATIYFLDNPRDYEAFKRYCRTILLSLINNGAKIWSYNAEFEEKFVDIHSLRDLLCYQNSGYRLRMVDAFRLALDNLLNSELSKYFSDDEKELLKQFESINDPITGKEVPHLYFYDWVIYGSEDARMKIINHNYCDLVREALILFYTAHAFQYSVIMQFERFGMLPSSVGNSFLRFFYWSNKVASRYYIPEF